MFSLIKLWYESIREIEIIRNMSQEENVEGISVNVLT